MQDKQNEYMDQAWEEMRRLLDQEMPVRRRRPVWWYWVGATCLLGLLWTGWYTWVHRETEKAGLLDASAKKSEQKQAQNDLAPGDALNQMGEKSRSTVTVKAPEVLRGERLPVEGSLIGAQPQASVEGGQKNAVKDDISIEVNQIIDINDKYKRADAHLAQSNLPGGRAFMAPITALPPMTIKGLTSRNQAPDTSLFYMALPAKNNWSFGIEAAATSDARTWAAGGFWGVTTAWQQGRWSIHSGLGWARQDLSATQQDFANESLPVDAPNPNMGQEESRIPQPPTSLAVRSSQLRLPLFAAYRLSPRWQVGVGVDLRYWLQARQQWTYGTNVSPDVQFDMEESFAGLLGRPGDKVSTTLYHRWDVAPMVQLSYAINDRWQWRVGARLGLTDMSQIDHVHWYDRSAWAGMMYSF